MENSFCGKERLLILHSLVRPDMFLRACEALRSLRPLRETDVPACGAEDLRMTGGDGGKVGSDRRSEIGGVQIVGDA